MIAQPVERDGVDTYPVEPDASVTAVPVRLEFAERAYIAVAVALVVHTAAMVAVSRVATGAAMEAVSGAATEAVSGAVSGVFASAGLLLYRIFDKNSCLQRLERRNSYKIQPLSAFLSRRIFTVKAAIDQGLTCPFP